MRRVAAYGGMFLLVVLVCAALNPVRAAMVVGQLGTLMNSIPTGELPPSSGKLILTESSSILTTETGDPLRTET